MLDTSKAHAEPLDEALHLLATCADVDACCDDANRRPCHQAFFAKVYVEGTTNRA